MPIVQELTSIVVNWKLPGDTITCVHSLLAAGIQPGRIVVVDNGSADDSVARLRDALGDSIQLLALPENLGFAGGNNVAIGQALDTGAEWVLLANNDTIVATDFCAMLAEAADRNPEHRLIAPLILYYDQPDRIWSLGDRQVAGTLVTRGLFRNSVVPPDLPPFVEVDFLNACCLLIHRSVFEKIGVFDTGYFMYAEDADFCWRARQAGFRLGCCTQARMWHKVSRSTGGSPPRARYWRITNQIKFYRSYASTLQKIMLVLFTAARATRLSLLDLSRGDARLADVTWRAWRDGWLAGTPARSLHKSSGTTGRYGNSHL